MVRPIDGVAHILLIRDPYQNWGLPKGHVEDGEDPVEAAVREVREETGLADLRVGPALGTIDWFFRLGGRLIHKHCEFYLMVSASGVAVPEVGEGITECVWVPADEAVERVAYDNAREIVREAVQRIDEDGLAI